MEEMDIFKINGDDDEVKENNIRTYLHFHFRRTKKAKLQLTSGEMASQQIVPAKYFVNQCICCLPSLQIHENLFR